MIENHVRSFLASPNLPFKIVKSEPFGQYEKVIDIANNQYLCQIVNLEEYATYLDISRYSKDLKKSVYDYRVDDKVILFFEFEALTEAKVKVFRILQILKDIHQNSSFEITLKKEHLYSLNNLYKVLDNKFAYLEMRIREIETSPVKNDISWIILSKYNIILDAKIYLYDLQQDIFKHIDKNEIVKYGVVFQYVNANLYNRQKLIPSLKVYYGPISMVYSRCFLSLEDLDIIKDIEKLDPFNQKYFCFMTLYIYILNLNLEVTLNNFSISNYLLITKKIKSFIVAYKAFVEK